MNVHRLVAVAIGGFVCWAASAGEATDGPPDETVLATWRSMLADGAYREVIDALRPRADDEHTTYDEYHLLAEACFHVGDFDAARHWFTAALRLRPTSVEDHEHLGDTHHRLGNVALAVHRWARAEDQGLDSASLHLKLARAYFTLRELTGTTVTRIVNGGVVGQIHDGYYVLERMPGHPGLFRVCPRASALYQAKRAQDLNVEDVDAYLLEADVWLDLGKPRLAEDLYRANEDRVPPDALPVFYRRYAQAALELDRVDAFLARMRRAITLTPRTGDHALATTLLQAARRFNQRGEARNYVRCLQETLRIDPGSADLHYRLGNALWEMGERHEASRHYRLTLELAPDHPARRRILQLIAATENTKTTER